jgi:hypothetical protein
LAVAIVTLLVNSLSLQLLLAAAVDQIAQALDCWTIAIFTFAVTLVRRPASERAPSGRKADMCTEYVAPDKVITD